MAGGLDDLAKPIDLARPMLGWIAATQNRNSSSLAARQGPGGAVLEANAPSTIRQKKHSVVGIGKTGEMARGLTAPDCAVFPRAAFDEVAVRAGPFTGAMDLELSIFIRGQENNILTKHRKTKAGDRIYRRPIGPVPPRDFIGVDERDVDAAAEKLMTDTLNGWGFTEGGA